MDPGEVACPQCGHRLEEDSVYRADYDRQELLDLGLSPTLVEFVFTELKPKPFTNWCESRDAGWPCFIPEDVSAVFPLWSCNADITALWVRQGQREFVKLYHDDPGVVFLAKTEQGLLARLFVPLVEAEDWKDEKASRRRLRQAAGRVGFQHLDEVLALYEQPDGDEDFGGRLDRLVRSLDQGAEGGPR
jgi:hypothetical protein